MNRIFRVAAVAFLGITLGTLVLIDTALSSAAAGDDKPRIELARDWTRFLPSDRARCLRSTLSGSGTYTDLLACLETKRDERQLSKYERQPRN